MTETFLRNPTREEREALLRDKHVVYIDFYATWCMPCKSYGPKFERASREVRRAHPDARVGFMAVDIDLDHAFAREHKVQSVPTTVVLADKKGFFGGVGKKEVLRFSGDKKPQELVRDFLAVADRYGAGPSG